MIAAKKQEEAKWTRCAECLQVLRIVLVASVPSVNFHHNSGNICRASYQPAAPANEVP